METIELNITTTIKRLKREHITAMSLENLRMVTPTTGVTVPVGEYVGLFAKAALHVSRKLRFPIYAS